MQWGHRVKYEDRPRNPLAGVRSPPPCAWLPPQNPKQAVTYPQGAQMFPANSVSSPHLPPSFPPVFLSFICRVYFAVLAPMTEWLLVWVMDVWFRPVFLCLLAKGERWGCLWWARVAGKQSVPADRTEVLKARVHQQTLQRAVVCMKVRWMWHVCGCTRLFDNRFWFGWKIVALAGKYYSALKSLVGMSNYSLNKTVWVLCFLQHVMFWKLVFLVVPIRQVN